jgi:hypothetical protein
MVSVTQLPVFVNVKTTMWELIVLKDSYNAKIIVQAMVFVISKPGNVNAI